jgi:pimeloyl-ACP methyl ester carboxylesterase
MLLCAAVAVSTGCLAPRRAAAADSAHYAPPKPPAVINDWSKDEFQFRFTLHNPYVEEESRKSWAESNVFIYIPAHAKKVRALLLLQENVVEQKISVHPAIRKACDANDIAIAWCYPGFDLRFIPEMADDLHKLVQDNFSRFGEEAGYPELGTVPLIVFGHSNTTSYAQRGAEARPDRILAAIVTHGWNGVASFKNYKGPVLLFIGSHMEQRQQERSVLSNKELTALHEVHRKLNESWMPISLVDEYGAGHYDYSEPVVELFGMYIDKAVKARLDENGNLRDVDPATGYIADIPFLPNGPIPVKPYPETTDREKQRSAWYFDKELAEAAAKIISGNGRWVRKPQMVGFDNPDGTVAPFSGSGFPRPTPVELVPGTNEVKFFPTLLDEVPEGFAEEGEPLSLSSDPTITIEYSCGPYVYLDKDGKYRVKVNRGIHGAFAGGSYLLARNLGDDKVRPAVQPTWFVIGNRRIGDGTPPIEDPGDQKVGAVIPLKDFSTDTTYVGWFVDHGPARVVDGHLEILPIPENTMGPVEVELVTYAIEDTVTGVSSVTFNVTR